MSLIDDGPSSPPAEASKRPGLLRRLKRFQHIAFPVVGITIALLALQNLKNQAAFQPETASKVD